MHPKANLRIASAWALAALVVPPLFAQPAATLPVPAPEERPRYYQARLLDALRSETPRGTRFTARIVGPLQRHRAGALPRNTLIYGVVRASRSVGLGLKRERAALEFAFDGCRLPSGERFECEVHLVEVDNAREKVSKPDVVQGILAASHPHSWLSGLWFKPTPLLFGKSALGLTGAGGLLYARLFPNPAVAAAIIGARTVFFRMPEPEIEFPAGTDLILKAAHRTHLPEGGEPDEAKSESPTEPLERLGTIPAEVFQSDGTRAADILNFAFAGSQRDLAGAFAAAGWTEAERLTPRTFSRTYSAFASMNGYAAAPVSPLRYEGRLPDAVFQKSFNTLSKRHHIRFWRAELAGETWWLGAATHDVGIGFDLDRMSPTHRIDAHIDRERNYILNDLIDAGCVDSYEMQSRPTLRTRSRATNFRITDGDLALVKLQFCMGAGAGVPSRKHHRLGFTLSRRLVLESRHYVLRGNPYYFGYLAIRAGLSKKAIPAEE